MNQKKFSGSIKSGDNKELYLQYLFNLLSFNIEQASFVSGYSESTIRNALESGELRYSNGRILKSTLHEWMAKNDHNTEYLNSILNNSKLVKQNF
jgi:hypothetical protein